METPFVSPNEQNENRRKAGERALWILLGIVVAVVLAVGVLILLFLVWVTRSFAETLLSILLLASLLGYGAWKLPKARAVLLVGLLTVVTAVGFSLSASESASYGTHFTEWRFFLAGKGMSREEVQRLLGDPVMEEWVYSEEPWLAVFFFDGKMSRINQGQSGPSPLDRLAPAMTPQQVLEIAGAPREIDLHYVWGTSARPVRMLVMRNGVVTRKASYFDLD
jgi:hypothetical protein